MKYIAQRSYALFRLARACVALGALAACGDNLYVVCMPTNLDASTQPPNDEIPVPAERDAGVTTAPASRDSSTAVSDAAVRAECPPESERRVEVVTGTISQSRTFACDTTYLLGGFVVVNNGATLSIEPGTIVRGDGTSALLIAREGKIDARGERTRPIVFTSIGSPGSRVAGGWQGLVLLGKARLNVGTLDREFEGLTTNNPDYRYGGSDDEHDCGTLRYVRVEFAGRELQPNKELNNLTVAGCGSRTTIDYVQLHKGRDDGIEFFGGTASAKHLVITGADDDSVDWDEGYRGKLQFVAIQQHDLTGAGDSNGFEASNQTNAFGANPVASPTVYNVTMIGDRDSYNAVRAIYLKEGTHGTLRNVLATGFARVAIEVVSKESVSALLLSPPMLSVENSLFHQIGAGGTSYFPASGATEDTGDDGFSEEAYFTNPARMNRFGVDPKLARPYDLKNPGWIPASDSPVSEQAATPPDDGFFDPSAAYVGAFAAGGEDWTLGWTAYPEN